MAFRTTFVRIFSAGMVGRVSQACFGFVFRDIAGEGLNGVKRGRHCFFAGLGAAEIVIHLYEEIIHRGIGQRVVAKLFWRCVLIIWGTRRRLTGRREIRLFLIIGVHR